MEGARAWRSFNAESGAGVLEKLLFTDTDKDGGFKPGFEQIKKKRTTMLVWSMTQQETVTEQVQQNGTGRFWE